MARELTEIRIDEHGDETHESWLVVSANKAQVGPPGTRLFDSEISHQHIVVVQIKRARRHRTLNRDWVGDAQTLMEVEMSEAQWGAFVSSFGQGVGVPATLEWFDGKRVPRAPFESRLDESANEVRESGEKSLAEIQASFATLKESFETNEGKKAMRAAIRDLEIRLENAPKNMEFAADSLTEHVENVVTKARADIEAAALNANPELTQGDLPNLLGEGEDA